MAEGGLRKCDWYGFSGFVVHRYCIRLSLSSPADNRGSRTDATCGFAHQTQQAMTLD